jgi:hypothetical protein
MSRAMDRSIGLALLLALTGCNTAVMRLPSWHTVPSDVEARSYTYHDPFPDEVAGPQTFNRPRVFDEPRTDTFKDYAKRNIRAAYGIPHNAVVLDTWGSTPTVQYPFQPIWQSQPVVTPITPVATMPTWSN